MAYSLTHSLPHSLSLYLLTSLTYINKISPKVKSQDIQVISAISKPSQHLSKHCKENTTKKNFQDRWTFEDNL